MTVDAMAPFVARSSAAMILTLANKRVAVFHKEACSYTSFQSRYAPGGGFIMDRTVTQLGSQMSQLACVNGFVTSVVLYEAVFHNELQGAVSLKNKQTNKQKNPLRS